MLIYLLAFVGGVLTILSPCILPVLPFVFAHADRPFRRAGLPLLLGMALTFSLVATAAAYGGHWVVRLNQGGRYVAMAVFLILGLTLLFPELAEAATRPLVRAGSRLQGEPSVQEQSIARSFILGISTGLLWAPCAGPILGLILTGAAIQGPGARSSFLLLSYALGAATSLAIALFAGKKVFSTMKNSLRFDVWIRRTLGAAVILGVMAIALGWDTNLLAKFSFVNTATAEERLLHAFGAPKPAATLSRRTPAARLRRPKARRHTGKRQRRRATTASRRRRPHAGTIRRSSLAQFRASYPRPTARQSSRRRLLDLLLHQLPPGAALRRRLVREI